MYAHNRVYGIEFGRTDNRQPFYLVLADEWYGEPGLASAEPLKRALALALGLCMAAGAAHASSGRFCDRSQN
jgi:hypothetical protein